MSDNNVLPNDIDGLQKRLEKQQEEQREIRRKKYEIDKYKIENNHDEMVRRQKEAEINSNIDLENMSVDKIKKIKREQREYLECAKQSKCFINEDFNGVVPFFARNILFAGAKTGQGKTTIGKNLAHHTLYQGGRVLYITNEENAGDVYYGVACLLKGWAYTRHEKLTPEQIDELDNMVDLLAKRLMVVDDTYQDGNYGQTTTLEGVQAILKNLHQAKTQYDLIIIDYYQNICKSNNRPYLSNWQVQEEVAKFLDSFKNSYLAPILVLSQLKEGKDLSFKEAIEGRKMILNVATCAMRITAERDFMRTAFYVEKSRFTEACGKTVYVGFDKGKYVNYNQKFMQKQEERMLKEEQANILSKAFGGIDEKK